MMQSEVFDPSEMFHMFDFKPLENNIWYFRNVLSYPEELLGFINEIDSNAKSHVRIPSWQPWVASNDAEKVYGATKTIRPETLSLSMEDAALERKTRYIINSLTMAFEMSFGMYMGGRGFDPNEYRIDLSQIPVKKWNQGQSMGPHFDGQDGDTDLAYSMVAYLNDDYEGGEIFFKNQNISIKPEAGSLVIFPSQLPYIHEVTPITKGTRYMSPISTYKK